MSKTRWMMLAAAALMGTALLAAGAAAKDEAKAKVELPEAVVKALAAAFPNATIDEVEAGEENGLKIFEVELKAGGAEIEVDVAPDGTILEIETEIALKDVPAAAAAVIAKAAEGAKIDEVCKEEALAEVKDGKIVKLAAPKITYEAELKKGDLKGEIEVAADGTIVEELKWKSAKDEKDDDKGQKGAEGATGSKGGCGGCGK